jgi:hypothetical protein
VASAGNGVRAVLRSVRGLVRASHNRSVRLALCGCFHRSSLVGLVSMCAILYCSFLYRCCRGKRPSPEPAAAAAAAAAASAPAVSSTRAHSLSCGLPCPDLACS